nr:PA2169 family four-helix-bundle protein [Rhodopseudomonas rhenobacensis]
MKTLHTAAIDARNGYQEALEDAEGHGLTGLFNEMIALHEGNARELAAELTTAGETPDTDGSFMSLIHQTIMNVRSLFNGLDGSVLPGLIDGEKRNVSKYDDALQASTSASAITALLTTQRGKIEQKIAKMEAEHAEYERASAS